MARYADSLEIIPRFTGKGHAPANPYNIKVLNLYKKIEDNKIKLNLALIHRGQPKVLAGLILWDLILWSRAHYTTDPKSGKQIFYRYSGEEFIWKIYSNYSYISETVWSRKQVEKAYKFLRKIGFLITRIRIKDHSKERLGLAMILQPDKIDTFLDEFIANRKEILRSLSECSMT